MDGISPYFICSFILARSMLVMSPVILLKFVSELWPLIDGLYSMKSASVCL